MCVHSAGVRCLESSGGDWLPSDAALGLCARRSGLRSVCQQRKAGGNRPQGQSKGYAVHIVLFFNMLFSQHTVDQIPNRPQIFLS